MSTTVKTGWLHDKNGDKFAPKTLTSQVQASDGTLLEDKIQADLDAVKAEILEDVDNIDLSAYETTENAQTKLDEAKAYTDTIASGKADSSHTHDDVYYTETEVDTLLASKSDSTHNHDSAYDAKGSADTVLNEAKEYTDSIAATKANSSHSHDDLYYTESEIDTKLATKADASHSHDDMYYTETEIDNLLDDVNASLATKADTSSLSNYYTKTQIDEYELITVDEIDSICGTSISLASADGVTF